MQFCNDCKATADGYHAFDELNDRDKRTFHSAIDHAGTLHLARKDGSKYDYILPSLCERHAIQVGNMPSPADVIDSLRRDYYSEKMARFNP